MKFRVKLKAGHADPCTVFEMDGDLDAVKTYLKLAIGDNFNWGAVERLDDVKQGEVNRWLIHRSRRTGELALRIFSFLGVDPEINVNAMRGAFEPCKTGTGAIDKLLGGGKF